jgi:chitinase
MAVTAEQTGVRHFTLAFILASDACEPAWGGAARLQNTPFLARDIESLRAAGGDVIISFGGAGGDELALHCPDVASLTAAYQAVVEAYDVTQLDFDIESDEIRDAETLARRSQAIAALQASHNVRVSFTVPVLPSGLTDDGLAVVQAAIDAGVTVEVVNIMTMNFGDSYPPDQMGANTIEAAQSLFGQLKQLYPDKSEDELWRMIGLTPMIGLNDVHPEVFTLEDAETVTTFAREHSIGRLAIWAFSRDKACVGQQAIVSNRCSGIPQGELAFSMIFNGVMETP